MCVSMYNVQLLGHVEGWVIKAVLNTVKYTIFITKRSSLIVNNSTEGTKLHSQVADRVCRKWKIMVCKQQTRYNHRYGIAAVTTTLIANLVFGSHTSLWKGIFFKGNCSLVHFILPYPITELHSGTFSFVTEFGICEKSLWTLYFCSGISKCNPKRLSEI